MTLRKVVARWPESGLAHELLGLSLARLGRGEEAISSVRTALELILQAEVAAGGGPGVR